MSNGINIDWGSYIDLDNIIPKEFLDVNSYRIARHSHTVVEKVIYDAAKIYNDQNFIGDNPIDFLSLKNPVNIKFDKGLFKAVHGFDDQNKEYIVFGIWNIDVLGDIAMTAAHEFSHSYDYHLGLNDEGEYAKLMAEFRAYERVSKYMRTLNLSLWDDNPEDYNRSVMLHYSLMFYLKKSLDRTLKNRRLSKHGAREYYLNEYIADQRYDR